MFVQVEPEDTEKMDVKVKNEYFEEDEKSEN